MKKRQMVLSMAAKLAPNNTFHDAGDSVLRRMGINMVTLACEGLGIQGYSIQSCMNLINTSFLEASWEL